MMCASAWPRYKRLSRGCTRSCVVIPSVSTATGLCVGARVAGVGAAPQLRAWEVVVQAQGAGHDARCNEKVVALADAFFCKLTLDATS
jgi:hypothetical protein